MPISAQGALPVPSTAQRKPSTTPTIGLIADSVRQGSAIELLGVDDRGDEEPHLDAKGTT